MVKVSRAPWSLLPLLAAALLAACASTPDAPPTEASITDEVSVEAKILAVDKDTRELTLERADGTTVVVVAGPDVRNFDQIEAGQKVVARYVVSLKARRLAQDEADTEAAVEVGAARAAPGERPAGAIGADVRMTVVVRSVDTASYVVTFVDPDGVLHAVEAEREEGRRFVAGLEPGDRVELVYTEALALGVE
jgi:hypothetical protein